MFYSVLRKQLEAAILAANHGGDFHSNDDERTDESVADEFYAVQRDLQAILARIS